MMALVSFWSTYFFALILIFLDQISKYWVRQYMSPAESIPVIKNVFHITYVENTGIAFGLFPGANFVFVTLSALIVVGIILWGKKGLVKLGKERLYLGLILGGAVGNLVDRLRFGFVVDFLDFRVWPVFNLADASVCIGGVMLVLLFLRKH